MTTATPTRPSKPELQKAEDGLPIFTVANQITRAHGADWAIQMPTNSGYHTGKLGVPMEANLRVWRLHDDYVRHAPEHIGYIAYGSCVRHLDNEFSPGCLMRSHGPGREFDDRDAYAYDEGDAFFLVDRFHARYGLNPETTGLALPDGIESEQLTVGRRILARFHDRRDREGVITRAAVNIKVGDGANLLRVLVDTSEDGIEPVYAEISVDYRQVKAVLGTVALPVR